jgi:hypothetical protein
MIRPPRSRPGDGPATGDPGARPRAGRSTLALLVLTALVGCGHGPAVKARPLAAVGMAGYHTFGWATPVPVVVASEDRERDAAVLEYTIRNEIDGQLAAKGYSHVAEGVPPDFLVDFGIRLEEKSADTFGQYIEYRDEGGKQGLGPAFVFGYEQGSLVIEVTDTATNQLAWRGTGRAILDDGQDIVKVANSVDKILADFPNARGEHVPQPVNDEGTFHVPRP